jgi:hypothetical protein
MSTVQIARCEGCGAVELRVTQPRPPDFFTDGEAFDPLIPIFLSVKALGYVTELQPAPSEPLNCTNDRI